MQSLRKLQRLLDEAFRVPGTNFRFGWDPIVGAVPWVGDALTALFSSAIIVQAHHMRVPRVVQLRMLLNIAIDLIVGIVPFIGDVADVFWKSNKKNFALLERHAVPGVPPTTADWVFVGGILAVIVIMALLPLFMLYWLLNVAAPHLPPFSR